MVSNKDLQNFLNLYNNMSPTLVGKSYSPIDEQYSDELTKEQIDFFRYHGIKMKYLFNAKGMSSAEYKDKMEKDGNKVFAYNAPPICRYGHTLQIRTKSGHCVECDPSRIAYSLRSHLDGIVYIAESEQGGIIKIGETSDYVNREDSLNRTCYASCDDWEIIYAIRTSRAGKVEERAQSSLSTSNTVRYYDHENHYSEAYEVFDCDPRTAKNAIESACAKLGVDYKVCFDFIDN